MITAVLTSADFGRDFRKGQAPPGHSGDAVSSANTLRQQIDGIRTPDLLPFADTTEGNSSEQTNHSSSGQDSRMIHTATRAPTCPLTD